MLGRRGLDLTHEEYKPGGWREDIVILNGDFFYETEESAILMVHRDPQMLVVSFDNLSTAGEIHQTRDPWSYSFFRQKGFSNLAIFAKRKHWFREAELIAALEEIASSGYFADFKTIGLTGTSMGGFAALAFARLFPGANVIAFSPQSTMIASETGWDRRWRKARARDWSLPFSDAAYDYSDLGRVYVAFDPLDPLDARHFRRLGDQPNLFAVPVIGGGHKTPPAMRRNGTLEMVQIGGLRGDLDLARFRRLNRDRRGLQYYKENMIRYLEKTGRQAKIEPFKSAFGKARRELLVQRSKK